MVARMDFSTALYKEATNESCEAADKYANLIVSHNSENELLFQREPR